MSERMILHPLTHALGRGKVQSGRSFPWLAGAVSILVIFVGLIAVHSSAAAEGLWEIVHEPEFEVHFTGVRFFSEDHGVVWGDEGYTVRTLNGGADWTLKQVGGGGPHSGTRATYFTDKGQGWVIYGGSQEEHTVYHTPDGGRSWEQWQATFGDVGSEQFYSMDAYFLNEEEGWLIVNITGSFVHKLLHTSDGGRHWELQLDVQKELGSETAFLRSVCFPDDQNGWAAGFFRTKDSPYSAFLFSTRDGGQNWDVTTFDGQSKGWVMVDHVYFRTPDVGWLSVAGDVGPEGGALFHTTDGGETWDKQADAGMGKFYFRDDNEGWAVAGMQILHTLDGGETWEVQFEEDELPVDLWLTDIHFINQNEGWAVGGYGTILHTTDGGDTWHAQSESIGALYAVDFTNPQNGWAVGSGIVRTRNGTSWTVAKNSDISSLNTCKDVDFVNPDVGWVISPNRIFYTSDSGLTWTLQFEDNARGVLEAAHFASESEGWVACFTGEIMHTGDGGNTWEIQSQIGAKLNDIFFVDSLRGWVTAQIWIGGQIGASGPDSAVFGTEDGGKTWEEQKGDLTGVEVLVKDICFVNKSEGWCVGWAVGGTNVYNTSNGGGRWELQCTQPGHVNDLYFVSEDEGWLIGHSGLIYHTTDGGKRWVLQDSGTKDDLVDICYDGGTHIYAVGSWGTILRYTDPALKAFARSVEPSEEKLITSWGRVKNVLYQNYPNPCNPETWIPYELAVDADVAIRIYDPAGRLVRMLDLGRKSAGAYLDRDKAAYWDGRNSYGEEAASGVYFYQLETRDFSAVNKLTIAR